MTRTRSGWLAQLRIHGVLHRQHFHLSTPPETMRRWLYDTQAQHRHAPRRRTGRFCDDAEVYLGTVRAMPTYRTREQHIREWVALFGTRLRASITATEIDAQLAQWRLRYAASTVNHRRTALMHLFTVLDGRSWPNPVKDTRRYRAPAPAPRAMDYGDIVRVLSSMRATPTRARLMVMAFTGLPQRQLSRLTARDIDLGRRVVHVTGRSKGEGTRGVTLPLSTQGAWALRALLRTGALGPFSTSSLRKAFRVACRRVLGHDDVTPYVLRHSFGTQVYRATGDGKATQHLMQHASPQQTARYVIGAVDARLQAAVASAFHGRSTARSTVTAPAQEPLHVKR